MVRFLNAAVLHRSFCRKVWKGLAPELLQAAVLWLLFPEKTTKVSALTFLGTPVGEYTVQSTTYGTFSGCVWSIPEQKP